jgi:membrane protein
MLPFFYTLSLCQLNKAITFKQMNLQAYVHNSQPVRYLSGIAQRIVVPGLKGTTLLDFCHFFYRELHATRMQERAAAVTYNFLMAMPPSFLFLCSLLPYLPFRNVNKTIFSIIKLITPNQSTYVSIRDVVKDFLSIQSHAALSYGIITVLFFSSNGVIGLMRCFDKSEALYIKRTGVQRRWMAIKITSALILFAMAMLTLLILQNKNLNPWLLHELHSKLPAKIVSSLLLILFVLVAISYIYTYGPSLTHRFRFISVGSVFATIGSFITTSIFFYLVNNFLNYNKVYGSIGSLIAFMVWVWLHTNIVLLGYELNVSLLLGKLQRRHE